MKNFYLTKAFVLTVFIFTAQSMHAFGGRQTYCTQDAIRAIEQGDFSKFQQIVPAQVAVDSLSSQGRSLLKIAEFHHQNSIAQYIKQQLTGRVIRAIEKGDLKEVQKFVPAQVRPDAASTTGRTLSAIAKYHKQNGIAQYLESQIKTTASTQGTQASIEFYDRSKPYFEFTNFYVGQPIEVDGKRWKSAEHYFQAQKFVGNLLWMQSFVQDQPTPREAFEYAREKNDKKRSDWEATKDDIMRKVLKAKFMQDANLKNKLINTGKAQLVEASPVDPYWGYGKDKKGKNMLGKLLMELRTELAK